MDDDFREMDSIEKYVGLSSTHNAMPRFVAAYNPMKSLVDGEHFDLTENELDPLQYEKEEEVFDSAIMSNFYVNCPSVSVANAMESERVAGSDRSLAHFQPSMYAMADFEAMKEEMVKFPYVHEEEGLVFHKEIVRHGNGMGKIPPRCKVFFHYVAFAECSSEPFDTSMVRKFPYVVDLRAPNVLLGYQLALETMEIGELARFIIPPQLAFLKGGVPPRIPPSSQILFVVEILHIIREETLKTFPYMTSEERACLPFSQILEECHKFRLDGNAYYGNYKNYPAAIRKYRRGIDILEAYPIYYQDDERARCDLLWSLYSNLALSYLKLEKPAQACSACKLGLKIAPDVESKAKLLFHHAKALLMFNDVEAAKSVIEKAGRLKPKDSKITQLKREIYEMEKVHDGKVANLYTKMAKGLELGNSNHEASTSGASSSGSGCETKYNF